MDKTLVKIISHKAEDHMMPFFWQHGEDEKTLKEYVKAIQDAGCQGFCVESRPHPDFCGPQWWHDMDIILSEAKKRKMKVWILDDAHFPTGYAAGSVANAPEYLCRQSVFMKQVECEEPAQTVSFKVSEKFIVEHKKGNPIVERIIEMTAGMNKRHFDDDKLIAIQAFTGSTTIDLLPYVKDGILTWDKPEGKYTIGVTFLTRNAGAHRNYINMMSAPSCKLLIDNVYEKHYQHYKNYFTNTIVGFFSDEPELGNGVMYMTDNPLGTTQDLPWSAELEEEMEKRLGKQWAKMLSLLFIEGGDKVTTADVRYEYMDAVTRLVQKDFSEQIGDWCRAHHVMYIGHVIEDNGHHCKTGSSLGHYFRGLEGQDMSGIDDIGGQVYPQGEGDIPGLGGFALSIRDGQFYHYGLASLGASAAAIEPRKQGRAMCEIFGNYGWEEDTKLMSYLADHFLVRNINYFVPHAFSPMAYPDPDCPPHFYAHGHNPLYKYCGAIFSYMNSVAALFSGGHHVSTVAVIYHGEMEWAGKAMAFEVPLRKLYDEQIFCDVIPTDVFADPDYFKAEIGKTLKVNTQEYKAVVVPEAEYIPQELAEALIMLEGKGCPVYFVNALPIGIVGGSDQTLKIMRDFKVIPLEKLADEINKLNIRDVKIEPASDRIRILHYKAETERYMFVNEAKEDWKGRIFVPSKGQCVRYQPKDNTFRRLSHKENAQGTEIELTLHPYDSYIVVFDEDAAKLAEKPLVRGKEVEELTKMTRTYCPAGSYPAFRNPKEVKVPDLANEEMPAFSGYLAYEAEIEAKKDDRLILGIDDASDAVEVFLNGKSLGLRWEPGMDYDLSGKLQDGKNLIKIEVANTLYNEWANSGHLSQFEMMKLGPGGVKKLPLGLTGKTAIYIKE